MGTDNHSCCESKKRKVFTAEIALHFPGLEGLEKPIVWMFPKVSVCLDCGRAEFVVPERELKVLLTGKSVEGAIISTSKSSSSGKINN